MAASDDTSQLLIFTSLLEALLGSGVEMKMFFFSFAETEISHSRNIRFRQYFGKI
jgi:hypothetical protein